MNLTAATLRFGVKFSALLLVAGLLLQSYPIIHAGLAVLVATPVARVVMLTRAFAVERDWPFAVISIGVLFLLGVSLALALQ